jgi:hypothetical protein
MLEKKVKYYTGKHVCEVKCFLMIINCPIYFNQHFFFFQRETCVGFFAFVYEC